MASDLEVRLIGATSPDGQIRARDLAVLADALQELRLRIGRGLINAAGPGRTRQYMEELAELRLRGISDGSTRLVFAQGPLDKLEVILSEERFLDQRFQDVVEAISRDERPDWTTDLIAESAAKLVDGLKAAAPESVIRFGSKGTVTIQTAHIHRETWIYGRIQTDDPATAKGRLEKVDLRSHEFRVRDDVGNAVDLKHVRDDAVVARLVGQWVVASGRATMNLDGRVVVLDDARVEPLDDPAAPYLGNSAVPLDEILASAPGPDADGGIDLTDEEFAAFLRAARS